MPTDPSKGQPDINALLEDDELILAALTAGVRDALREHKLLGYPVVIGVNGKPVWIPPEEIPVDDMPPGRDSQRSA